MKRSEYVQFMESSGFTRLEAEKMAGYALLDFSSFDAAYEYYFHSEKFWRGMVYEGHRKARRVFSGLALNATWRHTRHVSSHPSNYPPEGAGKNPWAPSTH